MTKTAIFQDATVIHLLTTLLDFAVATRLYVVLKIINSFTILALYTL